MVTKLLMVNANFTRLVRSKQTLAYCHSSQPAGCTRIKPFFSKPTAPPTTFSCLAFSNGILLLPESSNVFYSERANIAEITSVVYTLLPSNFVVRRGVNYNCQKQLLEENMGYSALGLHDWLIWALWVPCNFHANRGENLILRQGKLCRKTLCSKGESRLLMLLNLDSHWPWHFLVLGYWPLQALIQSGINSYVFP